MRCLAARYPHRRLLPEQRGQGKAASYRVPDVCVLRENGPREKIITTPPELCIEILSKDDSMSGMMERVEDYFPMGVEACWIMDPIRHRAWSASTRGQVTEPADGV